MLSAILLSSQIILAQWSYNSIVNTQLSDLTGEQVIPKVAVCDDGNLYVSWFSMEVGNYNVRLQLLDKDGNSLWPANGILVSSQPQMSWLTDWDLAVDPDNYALITFQDIRNTSNNPVGYRVSPIGEQMWGQDGIELSNNPNFEPSPQVCATEAGNAIFAWQSEATTNSEVHLQKVSPGGDLLWGEGLVIAKSGINVTYPFLFPAEDDYVYLIWHEETGPYWAPNRGLFVQKLDADGNFLWENDLVVYAPVPSGVVITLQMSQDNSGGIVFSWYGNDVETHFNCWVQYMDGEGYITMPQNGLVVSTSMARNHMYPAPVFLTQSQEIIIYFSEQDLNQNQRGLYAQKLDIQGNRLWTDEGKQLIALSDNDYSLPMASGLDNRAICVYQAYEFGNYMDSKIQAVMLNSEGNYVWAEEFIDMSSYQGVKLHTVMTDYYYGQWVAVWEDERNDGGDIYAQNIQPDGTLGEVITSIQSNIDGKETDNVLVSPNPFKDETILTFSSPYTGEIKLMVFSLDGQCIYNSVHFKSQGEISVTWNGVGYPSGFYLYSILVNGSKLHGKLIKN